MGSLKKAFAKQRAKDLAERAKMLMNKDNEITTLKKEVAKTRYNSCAEVCCIFVCSAISCNKLLNIRGSLRFKNTSVYSFYITHNDIMMKILMVMSDVRYKKSGKFLLSLGIGFCDFNCLFLI